LSQAANTFWVDHLGSSRANSLVRRRVRFRRYIDGLVLAVILAASAICVTVYWRTGAELEAAAAKHRAAAGRVEELRLQADRLQGEVNSLKNDPRLIESYARQQLGLVGKGDVVIKVGQPQKEPPAQ
jgi:cell division protein FtsB